MSEDNAYGYGPSADHMSAQVYQATGRFPGEPESKHDRDNRDTHWRMKDGTIMPISEMGYAHLRNSLRTTLLQVHKWAAIKVGVDLRCLLAFEGERGTLADHTPSAQIESSPYRDQGVPLLKEWARRGHYENTWWAKRA